MKALASVITLVAIAALFLFCIQRGQTTSSIEEDAHTGILTGTVYERCNPGDLIPLPCRGLVP